MVVKNNKLLKICNELGEGYSIAKIDWEEVIVKNIKSDFQLELSFLNPNISSLKTNIYVWQMKGAMRIVEQITEIKSLDKLKSTLNDLIDKYNGMNP